MRMWMVPASLLCTQHLLGEHKELHMLQGCLRLGKKLDGFIAKRQVFPPELMDRHSELVVEIGRRGFNHKSPIDERPYVLPEYRITATAEDFDNNLLDLKGRCEKCRKRMEGLGPATQTRTTPLSLVREGGEFGKEDASKVVGAQVAAGNPISFSNPMNPSAGEQPKVTSTDSEAPHEVSRVSQEAGKGSSAVGRAISESNCQEENSDKVGEQPPSRHPRPSDRDKLGKETAKAAHSERGTDLSKVRNDQKLSENPTSKGEGPAADNSDAQSRSAVIAHIIEHSDIPELEAILEAAQDELDNLRAEKKAKEFFPEDDA